MQYGPGSLFRIQSAVRGRQHELQISRHWQQKSGSFSDRSQKTALFNLRFNQVDGNRRPSRMEKAAVSPGGRSFMTGIQPVERPPVRIAVSRLSTSTCEHLAVSRVSLLAGCAHDSTWLKLPSLNMSKPSLWFAVNTNIELCCRLGKKRRRRRRRRFASCGVALHCREGAVIPPSWL